MKPDQTTKPKKKYVPIPNKARAIVTATYAVYPNGVRELRQYKAGEPLVRR